MKTEEMADTMLLIKEQKNSNPTAPIPNVESVEAALARKDEQLMELHTRLAWQDLTVSKQNRQLRDLTIRLEGLTQAGPVGSLGWLLVKVMNRVEQKIFPLGTQRKKWADEFSHYLYAVYSQGLTTCLAKGRSKIRNCNNGWLATSALGFDSDLDLIIPCTPAPKVSIIIPVFNKAAFTLKCLQSIRDNTDGIAEGYEIIIVDNASSDNTPRMLKQITNIKVITNARNLGFVDACNQGAGEAQGEYIVFLNNDTVVTHGWLRALLATFDRFPAAAAVGAKLIYPNGSLQEAGGIIWKDGTGWNYGRNDDPSKPEFNYVRPVDYCSGACLMVKKALFHDVGLFDRRYAPCYYEDTDLAFAIRQRGFKVYYQPAAVVIHHEGITAGNDLARGFKRHQETNRQRFVEKWSHVLEGYHSANPQNTNTPVQIHTGKKEIHKRILIVDHYVPEYDKDSGSLRMFEYIRLMTEMKNQVIFWPDNRHPSVPYTESLQQLGVEVIYGHVHFHDYLERFGRFIDIAYLARSHIAIRYIDAVRQYNNICVIYDTVDLGYLRLSRQAEVEANEDLLRMAKRVKRTELYLASQSDVTIVVSDVERDILEGENRDVTVAVLPHVYRPQPAVPGYKERHDLLFVGGFAHDPNKDAVLWFVRNIFPRIKKHIPYLKFCIVGSHIPQEISELSSKEIMIAGHVTDLAPVFDRHRVFVAPLRYGAGVKGKILQSMNFGVPVVTTPIGAEGLGVVDGDNILIAADEAEFEAKILNLYLDGELWNSLSRNAQNYVSSTHSPGAWRDKFAAVLATL